ncbi:MAG: Gfo/Idh/MocA family oxidoreductase [Planctomycetes bacterium]|nr:Gfo/Idh/MocA family oxidoreductase [Planctomycetota bacterium]
MFKAAVIGLGNIGFKLGLDPLRKETWSHVHAYERCNKTELVGAVEIDRTKANFFKEYYKDIPVFGAIRELMKNTDVDLVSICTPVENHYSIMAELAKYSVIKGIFCEKPMAASVEEASKMVEICKERGIVLAVNHPRSWDDRYLYANKLIREGYIGRITAVNIYYTARIFNMGSHILASVFRVTSLVPERVSGVSHDIDSSDPTISGWISCKGGVLCTICARGKREDFIFEVDVLGEDGRIRISEMEGRECIEVFAFAESPRYTGYRELFSKETKVIKKRDMFVEAMNDIVSVMEGKKASANCSGNDGLRTMVLCFAMLESARNGSMPVDIYW